MKKIPLNPENRSGQNKIRKMLAAGLPLAALLTGLPACASELGRGGVVGDVPMKEEPPKPKAVESKPRKAEKDHPKFAGVPPRTVIRGNIPPPDIHVVRKGDTLASIARQYGTTTAELKKLNDLTDEQAGRIKPGRQIKLK